MPDINAPLDPDVLDATGHRSIAGNYSDDDGQAIDDNFEAPTLGPQDFKGAIWSPLELSQTTRMLNRSIRITAPGDGTIPDPVQLLPDDHNRLKLIIQVTTLTDCRIASDKSDVYFGALMNNNSVYDLSGHTGALWGWHNGTANFSTFNLLVVTS